MPPTSPQSRFSPPPKERLSGTALAHEPTWVSVAPSKDISTAQRRKKGMKSEMLHHDDSGKPHRGKSTLCALMGRGV